MVVNSMEKERRIGKAEWGAINKPLLSNIWAKNWRRKEGSTQEKLTADPRALKQECFSKETSVARTQKSQEKVLGDEEAELWVEVRMCTCMFSGTSQIMMKVLSFILQILSRGESRSKQTKISMNPAEERRKKAGMRRSSRGQEAIVTN